MKKMHLLNLAMLALCVGMLASCGNKDENGTDDPSDDYPPILFENGTQLGNGDQEFDVVGQHTIKKGTYVLKGWVYVTNGATLTIEPGTVIKGDKNTKASLIVERGGTLIAKGTASAPIVFTSNQAAGQRKPGDWGGIVMCGKAKHNKTEATIEGGPRSKHGGTDNEDNSGVLSYVRIEFGGYPFAVDQEINGLTLGSVGSKTQLDHIQVSYTNDDSFEWFGGTVNAKYLIAYHGWDDDFDTDNGYSGKLQYLLGVRNPYLADNSLSNGFESDNNSDGSTAEPYTACVFSNVTLVGPMGQTTDFANTTQYVNGGSLNPNNGSKLGVFQSAMQVRRNSRLSCFNSVAMGYPVGLLIDNNKGTSQQWATEGKLKMQNLCFAQMGVLGSDINKQANGWTDQYSADGTNITDATKASFSSTFFNTAANNNTSVATIADLQLAQPNSTLANPNWGPMAGSPLTGKANLFSDALLQSGFDKVDYIGAFKSNNDTDNWTKGWANFDPQNTQY